MKHGVELVRDICKERGIKISVLEKECGFSNGYLNPKKLNKIPYERAVVIADYLKIPVQLILTGEMPHVEKEPFEKKYNALTPAHKKIIDDIISAFLTQQKKSEE